MGPLAGWMIALTVSVCATVIAAAAGDQLLHMATTGFVTLGLALLAVREHRNLIAAGASESVVGASTARYCGLVWAWGAVATLVTYGFMFEARWPEWWQFLLGFAFAAAASLLFASMLNRDAERGTDDAGLLKIGRTLIIAQIIGMAAAIISLFIDGKFPRDVGKPDWANCNIFFFGALAIAAISINALVNPARQQRA